MGWITNGYALQMVNTFTGVYVPTGITDEGLRERLRPWEATRLLDFKNMIPGTFAGFTNNVDAVTVDTSIFPLFSDKKWCCSGEQPIPVSQIEWDYVLPRRLVHSVFPLGTTLAPLKPHPVPQYSRPVFCDGLKDDKVNAKFLKYQNHPCTYLNMGIVFPESIDQLLA